MWFRGCGLCLLASHMQRTRLPPFPPPLTHQYLHGVPSKGRTQLPKFHEGVVELLLDLKPAGRKVNSKSTSDMRAEGTALLGALAESHKHEDTKGGAWRNSTYVQSEPVDPPPGQETQQTPTVYNAPHSRYLPSCCQTTGKPLSGGGSRGRKGPTHARGRSRVCLSGRGCSG